MVGWWELDLSSKRPAVFLARNSTSSSLNGMYCSSVFALQDASEVLLEASGSGGGLIDSSAIEVAAEQLMALL